MDRGNACYLKGDIELVSYEEEYYRDSFMGYSVVITFDGKTLAPSNTFSEEMIDYFKSDEMHQAIIEFTDSLFKK